MPVYLSARAAQLAADACQEFADRARLRAQQTEEAEAKACHAAMQAEYEALMKIFQAHVRTPMQWRRRPSVGRE